MTLTAIGAALALTRRKKDDEYQDEYSEDDDETKAQKRKALAAKLAGVATAVASVITFIVTEDMSSNMVLTDKWTILMAVLLGVQAVTAGLTKKALENDDEEAEGGADA